MTTPIGYSPSKFRMLIMEKNASQLKDVDVPDLEIWKVDFLPIGNLPSTNLLTDELIWKVTVGRTPFRA